MKNRVKKMNIIMDIIWKSQSNEGGWQIRLSDILYILKKKGIIGYVTVEGDFIIENCNKVKYRLLHDELSLQTNEFIKFLYDLLK